MLAFEDLGAGNWDKYADAILQSETVFPENIRTPKEEFIDALGDEKTVAKVALLDSQYIGNIVGYCMDAEEMASYGLHDVPQNAKVVYIFNIVVNPQHQGKGYGKLLLWEFIKTAKAKGYDYLAGHFRQNGSLHLIKKFGAKEENVFKNWENIGEDCVVCCLDIHSFSGQDFKPSSESSGLIPSAAVPEQPKIDPAANPAAPELHPEITDPNLGVPCEPAPAVHL